MNNFEEICSQLETLAKVNYNGYILKDWLEYLVLILNSEDQNIQKLRSNPEDFKQFLRYLFDQKFWLVYDPQASNELMYKISSLIFTNENVDILLNKCKDNCDIQDSYMKVQKLLSSIFGNDEKSIKCWIQVLLSLIHNFAKNNPCSTIDNTQRSPFCKCKNEEFEELETVQTKISDLVERRQILNRFVFEKSSTEENDIIQKLSNIESEIAQECSICEIKLANPFSFYILQCLANIADCINCENNWIHLTQDFCQFLKKWMKSYSVNGQKGYYIHSNPSLYQSIVYTQLENQKSQFPLDFVRFFQYFNELYDEQGDSNLVFPINTDMNQTIMDSLDIVEEMKTCYTDPDYVNPWYKNDNAKIIVDSKMKKTIQNGVFFLPDLSTALKIAKNGDKIIIKSGSHVIEEENYEINKNIQIIGTGPGNTTIKIISSFFVVKANDIKFENLKLEITKGALYLYGQAMFQCCLIESCINTVIYVMPTEKSEISIKYSILDGLTKVSRFLCLSQGSQLNMEGCIVKDMFSFCSVIDQDLFCNNLNIDLRSSYFEGLQDGIKLVLNPTSQVNFNAHQLSFVLDILDPDLDSHAIYISSQGKLEMMNISILATNADLKGIYCGYLNGVEIRNLQIAGHSDGLEKTSIGQGLTLQNVESISLNGLSLSNLRIGLNILHKSHCEIKLQELEVYKCSIGIQIEAMEAKLILVDYLAEESYYGMVLSLKSAIISQCQFSDVAKSMIIHKNCSRFVVAKSSTYEFPSVESFDEEDLEETLRRKLYIEYSSKLPFRIAYNHDEFTVISTLNCEENYVKSKE